MKKRSYFQFEIKGLNQERFFNNLSKQFEIFEIDRIDKSHTFFKTKFFDGKKVEKLVLEAGFQILSVKKAGIFSVLCKFLSSYGILAGLVVGSLFMCAQVPFIERIDVWGIENTSIVHEFVKKSLPSKNKFTIDCDEVEHMIKSRFDDLSFVSVAVIGQTLVVNVKKAEIPDEMIGGFKPIVSGYDGIVTKINLIQGTLKVKVGDIIQKGQILVEPKVINSEGQSLDIEAKAEVFVDVWFEGQSTHFDNEIITSRTGRKIEKVSVTLFGHEFYSNNKEVTFATYDTQTSSKPLTKNNILPFLVNRSVFYETKTQTITSSFEERKEEFVELARQNCLQNLPDYEIIKKEHYQLIKGAGSTIVKYFITANLKI